MASLRVGWLLLLSGCASDPWEGIWHFRATESATYVDPPPDMDTCTPSQAHYHDLVEVRRTGGEYGVYAGGTLLGLAATATTEAISFVWEYEDETQGASWAYSRNYERIELEWFRDGAAAYASLRQYSETPEVWTYHCEYGIEMEATWVGY